MVCNGLFLCSLLLLDHAGYSGMPWLRSVGCPGATETVAAAACADLEWGSCCVWWLHVRYIHALGARRAGWRLTDGLHARSCVPCKLLLAHGVKAYTLANLITCADLLLPPSLPRQPGRKSRCEPGIFATGGHPVAAIAWADLALGQAQ